MSRKQVAKAPSMTLDEKLAKWRATMKDKGEVGIEEMKVSSEFTPNEMSALWGRLKTARESSSVGGELSQVWDVACASKTRKGANKQLVLFGWLLDPKVSSSFRETTGRLSFSESVGQEDRWVTEGRMRMLVGDREFEKKQAGGKYYTKKDPDDSDEDAFVYLYGEHVRKTESKREKLELVETYGEATKEDVAADQDLLWQDEGVFYEHTKRAKIEPSSSSIVLAPGAGAASRASGRKSKGAGRAGAVPSESGQTTKEKTPLQQAHQKTRKMITFLTCRSTDALSASKGLTKDLDTAAETVQLREKLEASQKKVEGVRRDLQDVMAAGGEDVTSIQQKLVEAAEVVGAMNTLLKKASGFF